MKRILNALFKIGIGLTVNLFAILSTILNIWEFVKLIAVQFVTKLPNAFTALLSIFGVVFTVWTIFTPDITTTGTKVLIVVVLFLAIGLLIKFSELAVELLCAFLMLVIGILDASYIIAIMRDSIFMLVDRYINLCDTDIKVTERLFVFGICYVLNFLNNVFDVIRHVFSIIIYPIFALTGGWLGYWLFFIDSAAPILWSPDWWLGFAIIMLLTGTSIYIAYIFNTAVSKSAEDADFGLFDVFKVYYVTFKNFSRKYNAYDGIKVEQEPPKTTNEYFVSLAYVNSLEELRKTYKKLVRELHPDVSNLPANVACMKMADLNEAYKYFQNKFQK